MMRRLSYILLFVLFAASCVKEARMTEWDGPVIELTLISDDLMSSKAGTDGVLDGLDEYNENVISHVDFFFYPDGRTDEPATYHIRRTSGKRRSDVFRLELTSEQINTLIFPSNPDDIRSCTVIAYANYPDVIVTDESDLSNTTIQMLNALPIETDFVKQQGASHIQSSFIMSGAVALSLRGRTQVIAAAGTIQLTRFAAKLTVGVDVATQVNVGNEVWKPMLSGMELYLVNGVKNATLGGETSDPEYFSYRENPMRFAYDDNGTLRFYFEKEGDFYNTFPMYMYPQHWDYGSTEKPRTEPFLKLVVPWVRQADPDHGISSTQKQFYYKIVIPDDSRAEYRRSFVRNNWYHINVVVGILGAETDEATVPISGWCYIYDWQDKNVIVKHAQIGTARYLSTDRNDYELFNISSDVDFSYVSSHPVVIENIRATRPYYGTEKVNTKTLGGTVMQAGLNDGVYPAGTKYLNYDLAQRKAMMKKLTGEEVDWLTLPEDASVVRFHHPLNNDYKDIYFDYSPYTISYTLYHADHKDDDTYVRHLSVVQKAGIYIEATPNPDNINSGVPEHWGYVYVDNDQFTRADFESYPNWKTDAAYRLDHIWRVVHYSSGGTDMYKINVTVLPDDEDGDGFVIGDPRQDDINNLRDNYDPYFKDAPAIEGGERSLTWYYPTEASDRTIDMVAPSFRISTKLSGTEYDGTPYEQAKHRCASFQENGFPAGRWRLPTLGEIRFASQLSANGVFEWQFGGKYWSANGAVNVDKNNKTVTPITTNIALIRCVYDSWYWGDERVVNEADKNAAGEAMPSLFIWGDAKR